MDVACPEHVWLLVEVGSGADGRLSERYACPRCPAVLAVGPDDEPPHSPDLPT